MQYSVSQYAFFKQETLEAERNLRPWIAPELFYMSTLKVAPKVSMYSDAYSVGKIAMQLLDNHHGPLTSDQCNREWFDLNLHASCRSEVDQTLDSRHGRYSLAQAYCFITNRLQWIEFNVCYRIIV